MELHILLKESKNQGHAHHKIIDFESIHTIKLQIQ